MTTEARAAIADSRAQYFSDFTSNDSDSSEASTVEENGKRKPSYVGLSHSVNGYTPYAPYNGRQKKISPPLQIPVSPPRTLDSVTLVLNEDSYQKSVSEFETVMRDLSSTGLEMGRPERNTDITDNAGMKGKLQNGESFFPTTHSKQIISDGEGGRAVEIVTKFHCDDAHSPTYTSPGGSRQNLVQKQIERIYGDTMSTVRMTSPEPRDSPERLSSPGDSNSTGENGEEQLDISVAKERKTSGGFFAKRFGITKMKDHSTKKDRLIDTNSANNSPMEFKPLKVPAVFRLLRPEFREQLKQSSCKVAIPDEDSSKERIIPIRREGEESPADRILPISVVSPTKNGVNNNVTSEGGESKERVIPIRRENGGGSSVTPKRPAGLVAPKVNGFSPAQQANAMGLRQNGVSKPTPTSEARNGKGSDQNGSKQNVVRKLSPLSPKHIVVPPSSGEKPAITPKPEHLKSPPMSPTPPASPSSPPTPVRSQTSPVSPPLEAPEPAKKEEVVEEEPSPVEEDTVSPVEVTPSPPLATIVPQTLNNNINNNNNQKEVESPSLASPRSLDSSYEDNEEDYPEEFYEQYQHQPTGGLRERELLCPIMEEDNESTASGSTCNLATPRDNNTVIGGQFSPDDPFLATDRGEVQDGVYFIKVLENEIFKFEEKICDWEEELNIGADIPEEARDTILTVIGMGKLLMAQKLTQFRGLCDKNIHVTREEDPYVPTNMDLAGFWDMVHIQVEQIHTRFLGLHDLKKSNWVLEAPEKKATPPSKPKVKKAGTGVGGPNNKTTKPKGKSEAVKARDEARKKMLEDRKRAMKEKKAENQDDLVIIM